MIMEELARIATILVLIALIQQQLIIVSHVILQKKEDWLLGNANVMILFLMMGQISYVQLVMQPNVWVVQGLIHFAQLVI